MYTKELHIPFQAYIYIYIITDAISKGTFITLGSARSLQYMCTGSIHHPSPVRRVLPPTPGKTVDALPPSKPRRHKHSHHGTPALTRIKQIPSCASSDGLDIGIRPQLQRIAAEVSARLIGYGDRNPPPVRAVMQLGHDAL